ncbi:MAG: hypothetical protein ACU836_07045 [Gammaproteobacteria bacterium]
MKTPIWPPAFFERIRPTFMENWPGELAALAIPHIELALSTEETAALNSAAPIWRDRLVAQDPPGLHSLSARLQPLVQAFPGGAFVRLGSASAKDSPIFRVNKGRAMYNITAIKLLQTSPIVRSHLRQCLELGYAPRLFVEQWLSIQPWQEFRCFMRQRRWVGVSQLDCANAGPHPEIPAAGSRIVQAMRSLLPRLAAASPLDSAAYDVCVLADRTAPEGCRAKLVEINPWGPVTDACLFGWDKADDFDGSFRYLEGSEYAPTIRRVHRLGFV